MTNDNQPDRLEQLMAGNETKKNDKAVWLRLGIVAAVLFAAYYFTYIYPNQKYEKDSAIARQHIEQYVHSTYTDQLNRFKTYSYMQPVYGTTDDWTDLHEVGYGIIYYAPWLNNNNFTISYNLETGEIVDGYQIDYLSGRMTFGYYSDLYGYEIDDISGDFYGAGVRDGIFTVNDTVRLLGSFPARYSDNIPTTDPETVYDLELLSAEYGKITAVMDIATGNKTDFVQRAEYLRNWLMDSGTAYSTVYMELSVKVSAKDSRFTAEFTKEEIESPDFSELLEQRTRTITRREENSWYNGSYGSKARAAGIGAMIGRLLAQIF